MAVVVFAMADIFHKAAEIQIRECKFHYIIPHAVSQLKQMVPIESGADISNSFHIRLIGEREIAEFHFKIL